ncbi:MAG: hypothetical protein M1813_007725 [Trichoglossum hirsutum]|nr:MAG: hypothetical protein M1813_007725 [Trichoglossum hirsutum]
MATQSKFALTGGDPNRLHVLVLDGGGVRGVSSLVVLKALLNEVKRHVHAHTGKDPGPLKPHNVFDLAVGTSTGGYVFALGNME